MHCCTTNHTTDITPHGVKHYYFANFVIHTVLKKSSDKYFRTQIFFVVFSVLCALCFVLCLMCCVMFVIRLVSFDLSFMLTLIILDL
jgi:hypothetical protein